MSAKTIFSALFLLFVLSLPALAQSDTAPKGVTVETIAGTKYAVLIGINEYKSLNTLRFSKNDIQALQKELLKVGFEEKNVFTLTCGGETRNLPTKENILAIIDNVLDWAKEGDVVFIAMSGHGIEVEGQARFCTLLTNEDNFLTTTIPINDIFNTFGKSKATFKLMLVDACRDNPFLSRNVPGASGWQTLAEPPKGVMLFQSSAKGERSYEDPNLQRGIFTHYFVEGLQGKAADKDGKVTLLGLVSYTIDGTRRRVLDQYRERQVPYLRGEMTDFVLANRAVPPPVTPPLQPQRKAGERMVLTIKGVDYAFRWCPPGRSTDSPACEEERIVDEFAKTSSIKLNSPEASIFLSHYQAAKRQITLKRGFWMLETEVTQMQWESVMGNNPSHFKGTKLPVESVSWNDCQDYVERLNNLRVFT